MKMAANSVGDGLIRPAYSGRKIASPTGFHRWLVAETPQWKDSMKMSYKLQVTSYKLQVTSVAAVFTTVPFQFSSMAGGGSPPCGDSMKISYKLQDTSYKCSGGVHYRPIPIFIDGWWWNPAMKR